MICDVEEVNEERREKTIYLLFGHWSKKNDGDKDLVTSIEQV